jgi:1-deoxy-D-xylulose-5-phosphate reductoisomerase
LSWRKALYPQVPAPDAQAVKNVVILGSTGTIGRLTIEVIGSLKGRLEVTGLAANQNVELLGSQIAELSPRRTVVLNEERCIQLSDGADTEIACGSKALVDLAADSEVDIVVVAMTGTAALEATLAALKKGKRVALATKEILVSFGRFAIEALEEGGGELLPIDSEHNALHQCLDGKDPRTVKRLILTASGGPFLKKDYKGAGPAEVLAHPVWDMGERITVDSATLMNKGFEVIEAHFLFGIEPERIDVLVHPQSVVHSMVEFVDGSFLAQMAVPDMRLPIAYALLYPERPYSAVASLDLAKTATLEFEEPDFERFPCLSLSYNALKHGGTAPAVLQAADLEAVEQFLKGKIAFEDIPGLIRKTLENHRHIKEPSISQTREAETLAKEFVEKEINANRN